MVVKTYGMAYDHKSVPAIQHHICILFLFVNYRDTSLSRIIESKNTKILVTRFARLQFDSHKMNCATHYLNGEYSQYASEAVNIRISPCQMSILTNNQIWAQIKMLATQSLVPNQFNHNQNLKETHFIHIVFLESCNLGPFPFIHQVSGGIKHTMYYQMMIVCKPLCSFMNGRMYTISVFSFFALFWHGTQENGQHLEEAETKLEELKKDHGKEMSDLQNEAEIQSEIWCLYSEWEISIFMGPYIWSFKGQNPNHNMLFILTWDFESNHNAKDTEKWKCLQSPECNKILFDMSPNLQHLRARWANANLQGPESLPYFKQCL